eukprot:15446170-Alexandrium_andersonii.AAC.1
MSREFWEGPANKTKRAGSVGLLFTCSWRGDGKDKSGTQAKSDKPRAEARNQKKPAEKLKQQETQTPEQPYVRSCSSPTASASPDATEH